MSDRGIHNVLNVPVIKMAYYAYYHIMSKLLLPPMSNCIDGYMVNNNISKKEGRGNYSLHLIGVTEVFF